MYALIIKNTGCQSDIHLFQNKLFAIHKSQKRTKKEMCNDTSLEPRNNTISVALQRTYSKDNEYINTGILI